MKGLMAEGEDGEDGADEEGRGVEEMWGFHTKTAVKRIQTRFKLLMTRFTLLITRFKIFQRLHQYLKDYLGNVFLHYY